MNQADQNIEIGKMDGGATQKKTRKPRKKKEAKPTEV